jgi:uncharacterized protein (DUF4213/DUF364 family)
MKIIDEILSELDYGAPVRDIRQGKFQTAVLTGNCGLASTPHDSGPHHDPNPVAKAGLLLKEDTLSLAKMVYSSSLHEAAIGMATVNSLIEIDEQHCRELNAGDLLMEKGKGRKVAIVGHFPFIPRLKQSAGEMWVLELNPRPGDYPASEAETLIPQAEVVGITGTALTNGTIDRLLELCRPEAYVVILGGTTPLSRVLFDFGVDAVAGTRVTDPETVLNYVSQGATFRQIKGIRLLTMMK